MLAKHRWIMLLIQTTARRWLYWQLPTSSANTAARRVKNWKLKGNETHTTNNNRSRGAGGV